MPIAKKKEVLLVTGANGLVGSNLCLTAAQAGYEVRALVRANGECGPLQQAGIAIIRGDVTSKQSMLEAARGVSAIVHSAAVLGGTWSTAKPQEFWDVNYHGTVNVMEAARQVGARRLIDLDSLAIIDWTHTITEHSSIAPISGDDSPYVRAKRAAYFEGMHRASIGQDIVFVTPAGIFGPGPFIERALHPTSFTGTLAMALNGSLAQYLCFPLLWSYVDDVVAVCLAALERGRSGARYLSCGRAEDACSVATLCNRAAGIAGVAHRVLDVGLESAAVSGSAMAKLAQRKYADPLLDSRITAAELGVNPRPLDEGLNTTVAWLRRSSKL
jgi:nucleoside-diphosphate-sugar epimerase